MHRFDFTTLFRPFETGDLDWPPAGRRALLLNAPASFRKPDSLAADIVLVNGFKPDFDALARRGHEISATIPNGEHELAFILASRHRGQNEAWIAQALERLRIGGLLVVAGAGADGISSLRKRLTKAGLVEGHQSKNHGEVFWLRRDAASDGFAARIRQEHADRPPVEGRFESAPGMFSHDRVDAGSRLLAGLLPADAQGRAADFCAGWGYLSVMLAERAPRVAAIDLFEADHAALEAARINMARLAPDMAAAFHWADLTAEKVERQYDLIVMNPPFHQGRAADPAIGLAMIRAASGALNPGGRLFMVANRGLPYDAALKAGFARYEEIADAQGFKVWRARR